MSRLKNLNIFTAIAKWLAGKASKEEKRMLLLASVKFFLFTKVGLVIVMFMIVIAAVMSTLLVQDSRTDFIIGGGLPLSEKVLRFEPQIRAEARRHDIEHLVPILLAIVQVESGGNAERTPDVFQASESLGLAMNSLDVDESIEQGVRYFAGAYHGFPDHDIKNIIQSYNFGRGFLAGTDFWSPAEPRYTFEQAENFSRLANAHHGWQPARVTYRNHISTPINGGWRYNFGNMFYAMRVMEFVGGGAATLPGGELPMPVTGNWSVTSHFGPRVHPETGVRRMHNGIDLISDDLRIFAVADGRVVFSGVASGFGNHIIIDHGNGFMTAYGHNRENHVLVGDQVRTGQVIGVMGSTGVSTGVHLHFEVKLGVQYPDIWGGRVDPAPFLGIPR